MIDKQSIEKEIERRLKYHSLMNFLFILLALGITYMLPTPNGYYFLILIPLIPIFRRKKRSFKLEYSLDEKEQRGWEKRVLAWNNIAAVQNLWRVTSRKTVETPRNSSNAKTSIERKPCHIEQTHPRCISPNIETIQIKCEGTSISLVPDGIIAIFKKRVCYISNENIKISTNKTYFIEDGKPPRDATIIGTTWKYVNKDGSPDQRRKENPKRYECLFGNIIISTPNFRIEILVSDIKKVIECSAFIT